MKKWMWFVAGLGVGVASGGCLATKLILDELGRMVHHVNSELMSG